MQKIPAMPGETLLDSSLHDRMLFFSEPVFLQQDWLLRNQSNINSAYIASSTRSRMLFIRLAHSTLFRLGYNRV